jgi:large subunit ribosomal protein L30
MIEITLRRGKIATTPNQRENLFGLGLFRREQTIVRPDNASIRGMIKKVIHLVEVKRPQKAESRLQPLAMKDAVEVVPSKEPISAKAKVSKAAEKKLAAKVTKAKVKTAKTKKAPAVRKAKKEK